MRVRCPKCRTARAITATKKPLKDRTAECFKCGRHFKLSYVDKGGLHYRTVKE